MTYERLTCYFFSGTGNSFRAAGWMARAADDRGLYTALIPISLARPHMDIKGGPGQLVGIYHPTHGLMPPWSMIKFLVRLPMGKGAHAVVVATRGAFPVGPLLIPGAAGLALLFPLLVLLIKGYRLRGGLGIDLPVNMINIHWGLKPQNVHRVMDWARKRHQGLVDTVLSGGRFWRPFNLLWELAWSAPFAIWPTLPIAYLLVGRVFMAKLMFADTSCIGCGSCARNCPAQAIIMVGKKNKTPFWTHRCEACMRCMGFCRFKAVQASHLWMVPVIFGTSFLTASLVQDFFALFFGRSVPQLDSAWKLMALILTFLSLLLCYYLFWGLQRFGFLRKFFSYTTLTKFYARRYHAPETTPWGMNRRHEERD